MYYVIFLVARVCTTYLKTVIRSGSDQILHKKPLCNAASGVLPGYFTCLLRTAVGVTEYFPLTTMCPSLPSGDVAVQPDGDLPLPADPEEGRRAGGRPHRQRHLPRHVRVPQRSRGVSSWSNFIAARNMQLFEKA